MKKKNLTLAIILPIFFGSLGLLYSSWIAGIKMIVINVFFGIVLAFSTSFDSPLYLLLFFLLQPLMILWSVLIAKTKNHLIMLSTKHYKQLLNYLYECTHNPPLIIFHMNYQGFMQRLVFRNLKKFI